LAKHTRTSRDADTQRGKEQRREEERRRKKTGV
jgi:hypothetical protein